MQEERLERVEKVVEEEVEPVGGRDLPADDVDHGGEDVEGVDDEQAPRRAGCGRCRRCCRRCGGRR